MGSEVWSFLVGWEDLVQLVNVGGVALAYGYNSKQTEYNTQIGVFFVHLNRQVYCSFKYFYFNLLKP